jgi:hypothetical protein
LRSFAVEGSQKHGDGGGYNPGGSPLHCGLVCRDDGGVEEFEIENESEKKTNWKSGSRKENRNRNLS